MRATRRLTTVVEATLVPAAEFLLGRWPERGLDNPGNAMCRAHDSRTRPVSLARLSWHGDVVVRAGVAGNPGTPRWVLRRLSRDANGWVRSEVAGNRACPGAVLARLSADPQRRVRLAAAGNPGCPEAEAVIAGLS